MTVTVMLSTMNNTAPKFFEKNKGDAIVVNQTNDIGFFLDLDTLVINSLERGLSKSRNLALQSVTGDYALIADNDIYYVDNYEELVEFYFREYPDADVLTFQIFDEFGEKYKNYKNITFKHNKLSILKVSSVEIAFNISSIKEKKIKFDDKFGLGSIYPCGEENIFLMDCLRSGLNIYYINVPLVVHPLESSGKIIDDKFFFNRGAVFYKLYGLFNFLPISLLFCIKKSSSFPNIFSNLWTMIKGASSLTKEV